MSTRLTLDPLDASFVVEQLNPFKGDDAKTYVDAVRVILHAYDGPVTRFVAVTRALEFAVTLGDDEKGVVAEALDNVLDFF